MEEGRVVLWFDERGYGYVRPDAGGKDVFLHASVIESGERPVQGDRVAMIVQVRSKGPTAVSATIL